MGDNADAALIVPSSYWHSGMASGQRFLSSIQPIRKAASCSSASGIIFKSILYCAVYYIMIFAKCKLLLLKPNFVSSDE